MTFLYFLSGRDTASLDDLHPLELGYAFDAPPATTQVVKGPDDGRGVICSTEGSPAYHPQEQEWRKMPGRNVWLGWNRKTPPTPEVLARNTLSTGYPLEFNGLIWRAPIALNEAKDPIVPCCYDMDEDGKVIKKPKQEYRDLLLAAHEVHDSLRHGWNIEDNRLVEISAMALSVNYRVALFECLALELFDVTSTWAILGALVDTPEWTEAPKLTED